MVKHENSYYPFIPFGSLQLGRNDNAGDYKFGFNGLEMDNEVSGIGNTNTAMFWEYDTRLGRRWNVDPVVKPWESTYACFRNNPIYYSDPSGLDGEPINSGKPDGANEPPITLKTFEVKAHRMGWFERAWRNVVGVAKRVDNWFNNNFGVHVWGMEPTDDYSDAPKVKGNDFQTFDFKEFDEILTEAMRKLPGDKVKVYPKTLPKDVTPDQVADKFYEFGKEFKDYQDGNSAKAKLQPVNSATIERNDSEKVHLFNGNTGDTLGEFYRKNNGQEGPVKRYDKPRKLKKNNQ